MTSTDPTSPENLEAAYQLAQLFYAMQPSEKTGQVVDDLYDLIADTHGAPTAREIHVRVTTTSTHVDTLDIHGEPNHDPEPPEPRA